MTDTYETKRDAAAEAWIEPGLDRRQWQVDAFKAGADWGRRRGRDEIHYEREELKVKQDTPEAKLARAVESEDTGYV